MESEHHNDLIEYKEVEKDDVILVIKLANADAHEHAMMVILMHAPVALIAVPHANPFIESAYLANSLLIKFSVYFDVAMLLIAERVVINHQVMRNRSDCHNEEQKVRMVPDE
jgi:hypothetical protein